MSRERPGESTGAASDSCEAAELVAMVRLARATGVGPRTVHALLERFGSASRIVSAGESELMAVKEVTARAACSILRSGIDGAEAYIAFCREHGIGLLHCRSPEYPAALQRIHDPPVLLHVWGRLLRSDEIAVAIVGSRHATLYGLGVAERLARGLSMAGFTIVSGLARGIDQAAHRGALAAGGRTIAVLGGGLLEMYPPEHGDLARQIARQGAVISETDPRHKPKGMSFPQRNRIVTGLSLGLVVVEAAERSGAQISASLALEQGRDVFAVPGPVTSRQSRGCHRLIREGAILCEDADDVIEQLGPLAAPVASSTGQTMRHPAELKLTDQERTVLDAISTQPVAIDDVVARCGLPVQRVLSTISVLEVRRLVRRVEGSSIVRR